jgi:hypothetical protein
MIKKCLDAGLPGFAVAVGLEHAQLGQRLSEVASALPIRDVDVFPTPDRPLRDANALAEFGLR